MMWKFGMEDDEFCALKAFFGRKYGFLVFHDCRKVIYFKEVKTESVKDFRQGIYSDPNCQDQFFNFLR